MMLPESCKDPLLGMYYLATKPLRERRIENDAAAGRAPVTVLFYHRVADEHPNDWTIGVARFKEQMSWLRERFDMVSLVEAQRRLGAAGNRRPAVSITFDDGYADNCQHAIPWLIEQQIPLTYFVSTAHVLEGEPFHHDVARQCPLAPNTPEQLRELAALGVELGAHTRGHVDLGGVDDQQQLHSEIAGSKRDLETIIDRAVRYFAFPYGLHDNLTPAGFSAAFHAGYWGVCSAYGGYNTPGDDPFHIQRIHGDPSWPRFLNAVTGDPRKRAATKRFNPGEYRVGF